MPSVYLQQLTFYTFVRITNCVSCFIHYVAPVCVPLYSVDRNTERGLAAIVKLSMKFSIKEKTLLTNECSFGVG